MRADAQKNRQRLLEAAVELILEGGREPSRDAIAERAGLGIGTLYRHFPDQQALLHGVARYALERSIGAGERILADVSDPMDTLRQYMHAGIDNGIGVVNMIHPLIERPNWPELRTRAETLLRSIVIRAKQHGRLRGDLSERDIVFAMIRFARPLAIGLPLAEERAVSHWHLDLYIDGLYAR